MTALRRQTLRQAPVALGHPNGRYEGVLNGHSRVPARTGSAGDLVVGRQMLALLSVGSCQRANGSAGPARARSGMWYSKFGG